MGDIKKDAGQVRPIAARDLADFHLRWSEFRPQALSIMQTEGLAPEQAETLAWLIELADRVGEEDF